MIKYDLLIRPVFEFLKKKVRRMTSRQPMISSLSLSLSLDARLCDLGPGLVAIAIYIWLWLAFGLRVGA